MTNKNKVRGYYEVNGQRKEFEFEFENSAENEARIERLSAVLEKPFELLLESGKSGVKGFIRVVLILGFFAFTNFCLLLFGFRQWAAIDFQGDKFMVLALGILAGFAITIVAGYLLYQFLIIDVIRVIYESLKPLFQKLCNLIIGKTAFLLSGKADPTTEPLTQIVDTASIVQEFFASLPWLFRKGLTLILNQIPFVEMLKDLHTDISKGNTAIASEQLYEQVDSFIQEDIFGANNTNWASWLLPLNAIGVGYYYYHYLA